jgi:DNA-binding LacI/PurR family transcriptional regulator
MFMPREMTRRSASGLSAVNARQGEPLYTSVKQALLRAIERGDFTPQDRLPSTKELSEQMSVSLVTAHRALRELVTAGVLERKQGRGTFVVDRAGQAERRYRISLLLHREASLADFFHSRLLEGMRQASADQGVELTVTQYGSGVSTDLDAYLLVNPLQENLDQMRRQFPSKALRVIVGARPEQASVPWIDVDNRLLGKIAVEHLYGLGHRRIGYLGGAPDISNSRDRWEGFREGCKRLGLPMDPKLTLHTPGWRVENGEKMRLVQMLSGKGRPTAIFAGGYYFSLDVYDVAQTLGLHVPEEISVVGVDNPPSAGYLSPPLTTVQQPLVELGHTALMTVLEALSNPGGSISSRFLRPELIVRQSSGQPADAAHRDPAQPRFSG